jgi:hypothetical protein
MNAELRDRIRRLTMFYNSIDFNAMIPGIPPNSHIKRVGELDFLFFDKSAPVSIAEMYEILKGNSIADYDAALLENLDEWETLEGDWIPKFLQAGAYAKNLEEEQALMEMNTKCCLINFTDSNESHETLVNRVIGPCFSTVGTNQILLPRNAETTDDPPVDEFGRLLFAQVNSDITSPLKRDADLLDCYMNYIPNIERSKCVPFLKVRFLTKRNSFARTYSYVEKGSWPWDPAITTVLQGNDEQLAVFNFLNGANSKVALGSADWLISQGSKHNIPSGLSDQRSTTTHGMEMFTMPQSIQGKTVNPLTDPFRPLMSLDGATIHVYPAGDGDISFKRATIDLTLFDRTRLRDVSFLLDPSRFGSTLIEVEAGWEHPDPSSTYGAVLSAMRIKDVYKITKVDFAMKGSSTFNITIDAAMLGGSSIFHDNIFTSSAAAKEIREHNLQNIELAGMYKEVAASLGKDFELKSGKILPESIVSKASGKNAVAAFNVDMRELKSLVTDLQNAVSLGTDEEDNDPTTVTKPIIDSIDELLAGIDVDNDTITAVKTKVEELKVDFKNMILEPGESLDPFLVSPYDGVVEATTTEGTPDSGRQVGLVPGAPGTASNGALILPGDSMWIYQWNTTENVTASPPPAEARPGNPPHPETPDAARPPRFPLYWWARRNVATDSKRDAADNDVWENLWTARFPTLNNALAYEILDAAFPITDGTPPTETAASTDTEYISFGKLFLNLVAYPTVNRSGGSINEAHVITYNFNKYAAGLGYEGDIDNVGKKRNIASFAMKKEDIVTAMTKHLEKKYDIMPADILNFAKKEMSNRHNKQFGIIPTDDDGNHTDEVTTLKGEAKERLENIATHTRHKNGLQTDLINEEFYIPSAQLGEEQTRLQNKILEETAEYEKLQKTFDEWETTGEKRVMESKGTSKIKMPALKMFVETVKKGLTTIVRFHLYDSNEKPYEVHELAANMAEMLGVAVKTADMKSAELYDQLDKAGALTDVPSRRAGTLPTKVLNHRSLAVKSAIKANMPSITYGTEATAINSISLNSINDTDLNTHFMIQGENKSPKDPAAATGEPEQPILADTDARKIFPVTLTVDLLGCPVLEFAQQVFFDLGTSTDIDNIYAAIDIKHILKPGSFKTVAKMSPTFSGNSVAFADIIHDIISIHDRVAHAADHITDTSD